MGTCQIAGCDRPTRARGWCISHYNRWLTTGTPGAAGFQRPAGQTHHHWRDQPLYGTAHERVRRWRGPATAQTCVDCNNPAQEWAYRHDDPQELTDPRGRPYSADPDRYDPKCLPCHRRGDAIRKKAS